jgi:fumarate reductase iron-sulfur subunit
MTRLRRFYVARGGAASRRMQTYDVPEEERMTVLDGLLHIQRHLDRTLAFRFNCRAAMCGSCAVRVNGVERLACSTRLSAIPDAAVTVEPLRHLPIIADLMLDMEPFFEAWRAVRPAFAPASTASAAKDAEPARIAPDSPERRAIDRHRECISCGICYSSCDVVGLSPGFLGPAAMTRAFCLMHDSRGSGADARLNILDSERGCWRCHTHGSCANLCPKGIDPTLAIEEIKRMLARRAVKRVFGAKE